MTSSPTPPSSSIHRRSAAGPTGAGTGRRSVLWALTSLGGVVLFVSWLWLGVVMEGARQDSGQAGQDYADALGNDLGTVPVVVAHIVVLAMVVSVGAWSRTHGRSGILVPVLVCAAASVAGLLVSIPLFAPVPALP